MSNRRVFADEPTSLRTCVSDHRVHEGDWHGVYQQETTDDAFAVAVTMAPSVLAWVMTGLD
jgi:hypothetical protein